MDTLTGPTFNGRDDYIPDTALDTLDAFWARMPETWEVASTQGHMKSVTITVKFPVVGPTAQMDAMDDIFQAAAIVGALIRNLRWERECRSVDSGETA